MIAIDWTDGRDFLVDANLPTETGYNFKSTVRVYTLQGKFFYLHFYLTLLLAKRFIEMKRLEELQINNRILKEVFQFKKVNIGVQQK